MVESKETDKRRVTRLIRLPEVQHRVGLGRSTIYRWMAEGKFPKPVQLGGYAVAWADADIDEWIRIRVSDDAI
ncbi:MAG: AlpA family transcriptional regulator [Parvularcula sp.]|nr:AlpA family transcriptional regulator [Parvularcula sp.]